MPDESSPAMPLPLLGSGVTPPPSLSLWDEISTIQEAAVRAASVGIPLKQLQDDYRTRLERAIEFVQKRADLHNLVVSEEITRLKTELSDMEQSRRALEKASEEQRLSSASLRVTRDEGEAEIHGLLRTIIGKLFQFRLQHKDEAHIHRRKLQLDELAHQQQVAAVLAKTAIEDYQTNKDYLARAQADLRAELNETTQILGEIRKSSHDLQKRGLTRHVAGFLTWASYFSFAGIGVLIAYLLAPRLPDNGQQGIIRFQHLLGVAASPSSLFFAFGRYVLLLAAMITIVAVLVTGMLVLLRKLDPSWGRDRKARRRRGSSTPNEIGNWLSVFQLTSPTITKKLRQVDRGVLLQLLASIPIVTAIAMAAFVWIVTAEPAPIMNGTVSAKVVYIGILYGVLTASSGLLFWLFVLRPAVDKEPVGAWIKAFYSLLLALPISALVAVSVLPHSANPLAIALLGVGGIVATIGLGHGIYLRGIFSREDYLEQHQGRLRESFEDIAKLPTAEDYVEELSKILNKGLDTGGDARVTGSHFLWSNLRLRPRLSNAPELPHDPIRKLIENARVPEELVEKLNTACRALAGAKANIIAKDEEYRAAQEQLSRVSKDVLDQRDRLGRMHRYQVDVLDTHDFLVLRLKIEHQRIQQALSDAYQLAFVLARGSDPQPAALASGR